jgi:hypothetical protein
MMSDNRQPEQNTDREVWRERPGDYYADSIHVTADGGIGINCGGSVYVKPIREWHAMAGGPMSIRDTVTPGEALSFVRRFPNVDLSTARVAVPCTTCDGSGAYPVQTRGGDVDCAQCPCLGTGFRILEPT